MPNDPEKDLDQKKLKLIKNIEILNVLRRDKFKCQNCGADFNDMVLIVHHIDKDRKNNKDENKKTLCRSCHAKLHYGYGKISPRPDQIQEFVKLHDLGYTYEEIGTIASLSRQRIHQLIKKFYVEILKREEVNKMTITQFLQAIKEQQNGFKFGKPWRYQKDSLFAVLPIVRKSKSQRDYITLSEAKKAKIEDTGRIDAVNITNNEKKPLFIRAGEIFKGSTQERAAAMSMIVMPGEKLEVKVACVHQTKGIFTGAAMVSAGFVGGDVEKCFYDSGNGYTGSALQSNVWNAACQFSNEMSAKASTLGEGPTTTTPYPHALPDSDDLLKNMQKASRSLKDVIKAIPKLNWQTGLALLSVEGMETLECFDLPDSWTALREAIIGKETETLSKYLEDKENIFEFKSEKTEGLVRKVLGSKFKQNNLFHDNERTIVALESDKYMGQATLLGNKVIHLSLTKRGA